MGAHPTREGLRHPFSGKEGQEASFFFSFYRTLLDPPSSPATSTQSRPNGRHRAARWSTGGTAGERETPRPAQKRAPWESKPGTLQEHHEARESGARAHTRRERACSATDRPPSPVRGRERAEAGHTNNVKRERSAEPPLTRPRRPSRTTARSARGSKLGPDSHTPGPSTHHRHGRGGETRGPLAEREERSPFARNDHSSGMSVPRLARLRPRPEENAEAPHRSSRSGNTPAQSYTTGQDEIIRPGYGSEHSERTRPSHRTIHHKGERKKKKKSRPQKHQCAREAHVGKAGRQQTRRLGSSF